MPRNLAGRRMGGGGERRMVMPRTGDRCEYPGNFIDEHGHGARVGKDERFPSCPHGTTWWWHEDLPVAKHLRLSLEKLSVRTPRPGEGL
jgi:hypothetical protein